MGLLSLDTWKELLVVSLPANVSPHRCTPWQPDSHPPLLKQNLSGRGYAAVPRNLLSTSLESQSARAQHRAASSPRTGRSSALCPAQPHTTSYLPGKLPILHK